MSYLGATDYLGDLVCTTPLCDAGHASVTQMDAVFNSMDPPSVNAPLQAQFQSAHDSIMASFNASWGTFTDWIPFNPECCTIQSIGQQADALTAKMQAAMGQQSSTGPSGDQGPSAPTPPLLPSLGLTTGTIVAIGAVLGLIILGPSLVSRR